MASSKRSADEAMGDDKDDRARPGLDSMFPAVPNTLPSSNQNQPAAPASGGGLFGGGAAASNTNASQGAATGGFGSNNNAAAGGSLFGGGASTNTATGGGLFGSANTANQNQQQNRPSLFGSSTATAAQPQQSGGSLFGSATQNNNTNTGTTSLFGQSQQQQPQQGGSLFGGGGIAPNQQPSTSLFGASQPQQQQQSTSLFGNTSTMQQQQQQQPQNSIFGLSASQPQSLLNASQYRSTQYAPFAGKLSYGNPNASSNLGASAAAPSASGPTQGAVKISYDTLRSTTRFGDCIEDLQKQLEAVDSMIQSQERFCREIEAFIPKHGNDVNSLSPDVELIREKGEAVESALSIDAQGVSAARGTLERDGRDFERSRRVAENLRMPAQFHVPSVGGFGHSPRSGGARGAAASAAGDNAAAGGATDGGAYDMDLVGNFFLPRVAELKTTLDSYAGNLTEIEAHLRVMEASSVEQARALAARRAAGGGASGGGPGRNGAGGNGISLHASVDDNVRDLADTLRAFEGSILGAAGLVGECREGVNGLVLGRLGEGNGGPVGGNGRRPW